MPKEYQLPLSDKAYSHNSTVLMHLSELTLTRGPILDVGCADGGGADSLRVLGGPLIGIENNVDLAVKARLVYDDVLQGDASAMIRACETEHYSLVLCSDILEHLYDPRVLVEHCVRVLRPGGVLMISTPNLSNISNLKGIFFGGTYDYMGDFSHIRLMPRHVVHALTDGLSVVFLKEWFDVVPQTRISTRLAASMLSAVGRGRMKPIHYLASNVVCAWQKLDEITFFSGSAQALPQERR